MGLVDFEWYSQRGNQLRERKFLDESRTESYTQNLYDKRVT